MCVPGTEAQETELAKAIPRRSRGSERGICEGWRGVRLRSPSRAFGRLGFGLTFLRPDQGAETRDLLHWSRPPGESRVESAPASVFGVQVCGPEEEETVGPHLRGC